MCAVGVALECDKGTVPLSHAGKACLAQGFVEDDGGAVGEVECADAVVVRIDEVAADILPKDGLMAVLDMPQRHLVGFPSLGVIKRVAIAQHRDALAALGRRGKQWLGRGPALVTGGSGMPELSLPKTK